MSKRKRPQPPHSVDAEQSVLGGLMLDNDRWDDIATQISAQDFFISSHRTIYSHMQSLVELGNPIDLITLSESLEQQEQLGLMSQQLNVDYNLLLLDVDPSKQKRRAVLGPTPEPPPYIPPEEPEPRPITRRRKPEAEVNAAPVPEPEEAPSLLCEGTEPVTDIWRIPQLWDTTESLRSVSDRLAWDLAEYYAIDDRVNSNTDVNGIGFQVMPFTSDHPMFTRPQSRACWALLAALNEIPLTEELASALTLGLFFQRNADGFFFSDEFLIKAFRLIRIIRRIKKLQQEAQHAAND